MQQITVAGTKSRRTYWLYRNFQWDALGVLLLLSFAKSGVLQYFAQQVQKGSTVTVKTAEILSAYSAQKLLSQFRT